MKFPDDFIKTCHPIITDAFQWIGKKPNGQTISIVGGGYGLYGDGINTFEMWDYEKPTPKGWLTKEYINKYLSKIK